MKRLFAQLIALGLASIATAQAPRVRDSAGVRIVENPPRRNAPIAYELGPKPTFDVGGLKNDPIEEFNTRNFHYLEAVRLSNGNVVVIDQHRVHFFESSGKRLKTVGREGRGPGEYVNAADVCVTRGDTILIGQEPRPVTRLTKDGELAGISTSIAPGYAEGEFCFDDGTFVTMRRMGGDLKSPIPFRMTRMSFTGPLNTVANVEYPTYDPLIHSSPGKAARGSRFYSALSNTFDILAFNKTGKLELIIRSADQRIPITDAQKASLPTMFTKGASPAQIEEARKREIADSPTKYWPTLGKLLTDDEGRVWMCEEYQCDALKPTTWTAFDSTGRLIGRLVIPGSPTRELRAEVAGFGRNEVFIKRFDNDGGLHLAIYPIVPIRR